MDSNEKEQIPEADLALSLTNGNTVLDGEQTHKFVDQVPSTHGILNKESMKVRILKTLALYMSFAGLGFNAPIVGLTIVHLGYILNASTRTLAFTYTCQAIGYTLGGILCGLIYDRANKEFAFSIGILTGATTAIAAGFAGHFAPFMALLTIQGMALGFVDCAGQSYCVNVWKDHRLKEPMLLAAHALWSLSATIGPFIVRPFLIELHSSDPVGNVSDNILDRFTNATQELANSSSFIASTTKSGLTNEQLTGIELARYAFLTVGLIILCSGVLFFCLYFYECSPAVLKKSSKKSKKSVVKKTQSQKQKEKFLLLLFLFMLFMFYYLYIYMEGIPVAYFTAFAIKYLEWSVHRATLIVALFYGMLCAGRVIGVPLSTVLRPRTMVIMNVVLTAIGYILLLLVNYFDWIIWVSAFLSGYGMSSTYGAMILWVSESIPITGRVAAVLLVGGSFGNMTGPLLVGQLFDAASPMWMVYILVISSLLHMALFGLLIAFVKKQKHIFPERLDVKERNG